MYRWVAVAALVASTYASGASTTTRAASASTRANTVTTWVGQSAVTTWVGRSAMPGAVDDAAIAERGARAFVAEHLRELAPGASIDDFTLAANVVADGKRTVSFWQTWSGMRVRDGQLSVVIARDAIFFAQSQAVPFVAISLGPEVVDARQGRVVVATDGRVRIAEHRVRGTWDEWVGLDGRVLVRENRVRDATSTLLYDVPDRRPSMRRALPASEADIVVDGSATTTGSDGSFAWTGAGSVVPALVGPRVRVINAAGALATATLAAVDGQPTTWSLASDELGDAQLSAFVHATIGKARAKALFPGLAWVDQRLDVSVNEPGGACNASSTGDDLHFFAGNAMCENTARLADVLYHELGHSVHFQALIPAVGNYNLALSEGLADFFAVSITGDPAVGRGYRLDDTPVRQIDPLGFEYVVPDDLVPSQHQSGLIIGGALWDLRRLLIHTHGLAEGIARTDRVFAGVIQRAPNIANSYMAALVGDDDDGDLANGTPNKCEIDVAFAQHGLASSVALQTIEPPVFDAETSRLSLRVTGSSPACAPVITGGTLWWWSGDREVADQEVHEVPLFFDGERVFETLSPAPPPFTQWHYRVAVSFDDGSLEQFPNNRADPIYTGFTGPVDCIECDWLVDDPLAHGWTQATTGSPTIWEYGVPLGLAGDPMSGTQTTKVLGTVLAGDGRYASITDTSVSTPPIEVTDHLGVRLQFERWLTVEDGMYDQASVEINGTPIWTNTATAEGFTAHYDREWRFVDFDITSFAQQGPMTITWRIRSDSSRSLGGWNLGSVKIVGIGLQGCGNNIADEGEECDGTDDCTSDCTIDEGCCSAGGGPRGSALLVLGVVIASRRRRRRR